MKKSNVKIISIMASLALIGLTAIQVYWVNNAISLGEQRFEQNVNEALNNVVSRMEKQSAAANITKKINFRKQGIRWFTPQDSLKHKAKFLPQSLTDKQAFSLKKDKINVNIYEEFSLDSNGVVVKKTRQKNYSADSTSHNLTSRLENDGPLYFQQLDSGDLSNKWFSHKNDVANDIFDELVSINIYNDYNQKIDTILLDSVIQVELLEKGISTDYIFDILSSKNPPLDTAKLSERKKKSGYPRIK